MNKEDNFDYYWRNTTNLSKKRGRKSRLQYIDYTKAINLYEKSSHYYIASVFYRQKTKRTIAVKRKSCSLTERDLRQSFIMNSCSEWFID